MDGQYTFLTTILLREAHLAERFIGCIKEYWLPLTPQVYSTGAHLSSKMHPADLNFSEIWQIGHLLCTRQRCRLNICSYTGWIDDYSICQFNQYIYKYWDGSAVYCVLANYKKVVGRDCNCKAVLDFHICCLRSCAALAMERWRWKNS